MGKSESSYRRLASGLLLAMAMVLAVGCSSSSEKSANSSSKATADMAAPASMSQLDAKSKQMDSLANETAKNNEAAGTSGASAAGSAAAGPAGDKQTEANKVPPATQAQTGFAQTNAPDALNRKLIYKANMTMEAADYGKVQTQIRDLVQLKGAYILQFSENQTSNEQSGNFVIKVPAGGFSSLLADLDKVETLKTQRNLQGQDVSEEYVDLESRLKAKLISESRLLAFMEKATKTDDLVAFSNELSKVQQEIEQIRGRMRYLDQNVAMSTIEIRLYQKLGIASAKRAGDPAASLGNQASAALSDSFRVMGVVISKLIVFFAGALPVLIALAAIIVPALYVNKKRKRKDSGLPKPME